MPRNKDLKRLVRSRMKKTGESYTSARANIAGRAKPEVKSKYAAPRKDWPVLAGMSDEAIRKKTGRTWADWIAALDNVHAYRMSHSDIAKHVAANYDIGGWWTQTVTVGYERIRGLRDVGQKRTGEYEANKSRTFPIGLSALYRMFADARRRKLWLPEGWVRTRSSIQDKSIRVDWHNGTQVNFYFVSKGPAKSMVAVQHAKLNAKGDIAKAKNFWSERLDALGELLGSN